MYDLFPTDLLWKFDSALFRAAQYTGWIGLERFQGHQINKIKIFGINSVE